MGLLLYTIFKLKSEVRTLQNMDDFPFIWKILREKGYVTQWGEDGHQYGTFAYRMVGFNKQPVDHYMRNYYMSLDKERKCQGSYLRLKYRSIDFIYK